MGLEPRVGWNDPKAALEAHLEGVQSASRGATL